MQPNTSLNSSIRMDRQFWCFEVAKKRMAYKNEITVPTLTVNLEIQIIPTLTFKQKFQSIWPLMININYRYEFYFPIFLASFWLNTVFYFSLITTHNPDRHTHATVVTHATNISEFINVDSNYNTCCTFRFPYEWTDNFDVLVSPIKQFEAPNVWLT